MAILNNQAYIGKLVWNKLRKDPETRKRRSKINNTESVIKREVPQLRIVEQDLWEAAKRRQADVMLGPQRTMTKPWDRRMASLPALWLVKCGAYSGGYVQISKTHLGCATSRNKGTCGNRLGTGRQALERTILDGLKTHLMGPELFKEFCAEFIKKANWLRQAQQSSGPCWRPRWLASNAGSARSSRW